MGITGVFYALTLCNVSNDYNYTKLQPYELACITPEQWLLLVESHASPIALENFLQWPLIHQLVFIPANCYSYTEMKDVKYSPCDLISTGITPIALQEVMVHFAQELGTRHSQEAKKTFCIYGNKFMLHLYYVQFQLL